MSLTSQDAGGDFSPAPPGTFIARCYRVIDLGTHLNTRWGDMQRKVSFSWELPEQKMDDGQPFSVHTQYTNSLSEKAYLRRDLEAWRGRPFTDTERAGFDLRKVLGAPCYLNIIHSPDGKYANVQSIIALPAGTNCPQPINPPVTFDIDQPDMAIYETFGQSIKKTIADSQEWVALMQASQTPR